jgi:hypothetical protein
MSQVGRVREHVCALILLQLDGFHSADIALQNTVFINQFKIRKLWLWLLLLLLMLLLKAVVVFLEVPSVELRVPTVLDLSLYTLKPVTNL